MKRLLSLLLIASTLTAPAFAAGDLPQTPITKEKKKTDYPKIVLYSVSWCPHCTAAKEYMTSHNIPFINKDVEVDPKAMDELTDIYKSQSVPVFVIGEKGKVVKGFTPEAFEKAVKEVQKTEKK